MSITLGSVRVVAVIQARAGSARLPGKILAPLGDSTVLGWCVRAARQAGLVDEVVVATSTDPTDDVTAAECDRLDVACVRGDLDDLTARYVSAARVYPAEAYVRLTADCPLLDPELIDECIAVMKMSPEVDLVSNCIGRTYPRGLDVEVLSARALQRVDAEARDYHRVHVTTWITDTPSEMKVVGLVDGMDNSDLRVTVDYPEDLAVVQKVAMELGPNVIAYRDLIDFLRVNHDVAAINANVRQKEISEG